MSQKYPKTNQSTQLAQYDIPAYRRDPYGRDQTQVDVGLIAALILSVIIAIAIWSLCFWRLTSKAGYTGAVRWIFFLTMAFPLTTTWSLLIFVLLPWPIQKQLTQRQTQSIKPIDDIEEEINRLKKLNREK